ncbi:probable fibrosin-1 [Corvus kubaryi]|uniref:probable fibrosin-1 n=1 Tax=Corvus kubaryi TaxID=68294 RepID=UPI001C04D484|nr:probable fibrosin-1 [Corvus kubaryi]
MDALALPRREGAAGSGRCRRDSGAPETRERGRQRRLERARRRLPERRGREASLALAQGAGAAAAGASHAAAHPLYTAGPPAPLTHTHARRARSRGAARSAPLPPSSPLLLPPRQARPPRFPRAQGSAGGAAAPPPGHRHRPATAARCSWPPPPGTCLPRSEAPSSRLGSSGRQKDGRETLGMGDPSPSAGSTRGAPVPHRNARQGSEVAVFSLVIPEHHNAGLEHIPTCKHPPGSISTCHTLN